jgi:hypothetical protein
LVSKKKTKKALIRAPFLVVQMLRGDNPFTPPGDCLDDRLPKGRAKPATNKPGVAMTISPTR